MKEVEFTSELICSILFGLQNGKKIIKETYKKFDDEFPNSAIIEERFAQVLEECKIILDENIKDLEFRRMPLFYSFFCCVYDLKFGLSTMDRDIKNLNIEKIAEVRTNLYNLSSTISGDEIYEDYIPFSSASKSSTDKISNRIIRHQVLTNIINPIYE